MMWATFLKRLEEKLQILEDRLEKQTPPANNHLKPRPAVVFDSSGRMPEKNEVHVGIGEWISKGNPPKIVGDGISMNNKMGKTFTSIQSTNIPSVTDLVLTANDELLNFWKSKTSPFSLDSFFTDITIIVEDASPDSCIGLICFLARMSGVEPDNIPHNWVRYVRRWEMGDVKTTGKPFSSFGALHSALAHGYFEPNKAEATPSTIDAVNLSMGLAWLACLRFDLAALQSGASPSNFNPEQSWPELWQARAFLNYEYQQYLQSLQHATTLQLELPMTGAGDRTKLVDAFIEEEYIPLGSKKCFVRNDQENSWLGDGFTFMGLYRPWEKGSGNDMTITVEPTSAVHLRDLWLKLEELEDEKWGKDRPCDEPRKGIMLYPDGKRADGTNAPNQPWYDEQGRYTLIGAPKFLKVKNGGRVEKEVPGTQLSWPEVVNALWEQYCPVRNLKVIPRCQDQDGIDEEHEEEKQKPCMLHQCPDLNASCSQLSSKKPSKKRFIIAQWIVEGTQSQSVLLSPTVQRYMAAHAAGNHKTAGIIPFHELPDLNSFDFVKIPGGFGVIHENGVFFIDDWQTEKLDVTGIKGQVDAIEQRLDQVRKINLSLNEIIKNIRYQSPGSTKRSRGDLKLMEQLSNLKFDMQQTLAATGIKNPKTHLKEVREYLEKRWEIDQRLEAFYEAADQIEQTIRGHSELQTNRFINNLTIYAFPFAFFGAFFGFIVEGIPDTITISGKKLFLGGWGVNWLALAIYIIISLFVVGIFYRIYEKRQEATGADREKNHQPGSPMT